MKVDLLAALSAANARYAEYLRQEHDEFMNSSLVRELLKNYDPWARYGVHG